jgi:hypothetical protein
VAPAETVPASPGFVKTPAAPPANSETANARLLTSGINTQGPSSAIVQTAKEAVQGGAPNGSAPHGSSVEATMDSQGSASPNPHTMELSIDSLSHLQLTEAIPVTVKSLGDRLFTASVDALGVGGTGDTPSDALIIVKEQIELLCERLTKASRLDEDEKTYLQFLQSHIKLPEDSHRHRRLLWR